MLVAALAGAGGGVVPIAAMAEPTHRYISMALQGDLSNAASLFETEDAATEDEGTLARNFRDRFVLRKEARPPVSGDAFVQRVVNAYEQYWTAALMGDVPLEEGEAELKRRLRSLLDEAGVPGGVRNGAASPAGRGGNGEDDNTLDRLTSAIEARGLSVINGRTRPLLELMLWTDREAVPYDVTLTDTNVSVPVVFIGGFLVRGWAHFATFGAASTGGWATRDSLFCLRDDYDLDSERFRVSYLQHEGRHFADYGIFPELEQIDLEYRAKLTEFAFAEETCARLVRHFASSAEPNEAAPHSYANFAVIRDLSTALFGEAVSGGEDPRWSEVTPEQFHAAARRLLGQSDEALHAAGAATTRGVVAAR